MALTNKNIVESVYNEDVQFGEGKMNPVPDQRQYPRHTALFSVKYTIKEGMFRDLIKNIGAGGVFVSSRRKIQLGRSINLQIPISAFKKKLSLMGTVVRCNSTGFAVRLDNAIEAKIYNQGRFPGMVKADGHATEESS